VRINDDIGHLPYFGHIIQVLSRQIASAPLPISDVLEKQNLRRNDFEPRCRVCGWELVES